MIVIALLVWFGLCLLVAALAAERGRSAFGFFLLSFFFSPLVGLIAVLIAGSTAELKAQPRDPRADLPSKRLTLGTLGVTALIVVPLVLIMLANKGH